MTTSSRKHLEDISHAYRVSLLYKLITSSKDTYDLSMDFDRDCQNRQRELTNNTNINCKYIISFRLRDKFAFAEHQEKATHG